LRNPDPLFLEKELSIPPSSIFRSLWKLASIDAANIIIWFGIGMLSAPLIN
jgi:hypothetical protein